MFFDLSENITNREWISIANAIATVLYFFVQNRAQDERRMKMVKSFNELIQSIEHVLTASEKERLERYYNDSLRLFWQDEKAGFKTYAEKYESLLQGGRLQVEANITADYIKVASPSASTIHADQRRLPVYELSWIKSIDKEIAQKCKEVGTKFTRSPQVRSAKQKDNYDAYIRESMEYNVLFDHYVELWKEVVERGLFSTSSDYLRNFASRLGWIINERSVGTRINGYSTAIRLYQDAVYRLMDAHKSAVVRGNIYDKLVV